MNVIAHPIQFTRLLALAAVIAFAAGATACSGGSGTGGDSPPVDLIPVDACESVRDCVGGEQCEDGYCREMCGEEEPCMGPLQICDLTAGLCAACIDDDDCDEGQSCQTLYCGATCGDAPACEEGETCVPEEGLCLPESCEEDEDCPGGYSCDEEVCAPLAPPGTGACVPGTSRCDGDLRIGCSPRGNEIVEDCSEQDARCVRQGAGVVCEALPPTSGPCEDGTRGCTNDTTAWTCVEGIVEQDRCAGGRVCEAGSCVAGPGPTDPPPTGTCEENEVGCVDDATPWWCDDGNRIEGICFASTVCSAGQCVPEGTAPECEAGESGCVDAATRWTCVEETRVTSACGAGLFCEQGACVPDDTTSECDAGDGGCVNIGSAWACVDGERVTTTCGLDQSCMEGECVNDPEPGDDCGQTVVTCSSPDWPSSRVLVSRVEDTVTCSASGSTGANEQPATSYAWSWMLPLESSPALQPSSTARDVSFETGGNDQHVLRVRSSNASGQACEEGWVQLASVNRELFGLTILLAWRDEATGSPLSNQDLDLYLRRGTSGQWRSQTNSVYYSQRSPTWTNDSGGSMSPVLLRDALRDGGPEVIQVESWFTNETFSVGVHFFSATTREPALLDLMVVAGGQVRWSRENIRISREADFWHAFNFTGATPSFATVNSFSTLPQ